MNYFEAKDGHDESTIWEGVRYSSSSIPNAVIRQHDVPEKYWPDVVARMTGTVVTNDDATVKRVAMALLICEAGPDATEFIWDDKYATRARAVLATLTGVPHD